MKKFARARSKTSRDLSPLPVDVTAATEHADTEAELFGSRFKSGTLRRSARIKCAGTTAVQETQTPMPLNEIRNGVVPPPPDSRTATRGVLRRHCLKCSSPPPHTEILFPVVLIYLLQVGHFTSLRHLFWSTTIYPRRST